MEEKKHYNKITPRFSPNSTNGGNAYFWKTKRIYKSCGLAQLISICTLDVLRQDLAGRNKGTCHTNSDNLSSFPGLGNSREELWVFHGHVFFDSRNSRSVLFCGRDFNEPCSILYSNSFHSKLGDLMSDSYMWEKMPEDWAWNGNNANMQNPDMRGARGVQNIHHIRNIERSQFYTEIMQWKGRVVVLIDKSTLTYIHFLWLWFDY